MKSIAIICNIALLGFIGWVLLTDGLPTKAYYILFTVWSLLTPIVTSTLFFRKRTNAISKGIGIVCNILFLAFTIYALADQYPHHPKEDGLIAFVVLITIAPILSLAVLLRMKSADSFPS